MTGVSSNQVDIKGLSDLVSTLVRFVSVYLALGQTDQFLCSQPPSRTARSCDHRYLDRALLSVQRRDKGAFGPRMVSQAILSSLQGRRLLDGRSKAIFSPFAGKSMSYSYVRCQCRIDRVAFTQGTSSSHGNHAVFEEFSLEAVRPSTVFQLGLFSNNPSQDVTIGSWLRTVSSFS